MGRKVDAAKCVIRIPDDRELTGVSQAQAI
jgi:hypothetical protein